MADKDTSKKHPSYGSVVLSHVSAGGRDGGVTLFRSQVRHANLVQLEIHEAEVISNETGSYERVLPGKSICTIWFSESQFASFVSSFGRGEGTPCTLKRTQKDFDIPAPPLPPPIIHPYTADVKETIKQMLADLENARKNLNLFLMGEARPTKANLKEMMGLLDSVQRNLKSNLPYIEECFVESLEHQLSQAAIEFESFMQRTLEQRGLEALRGELPRLQGADGEDSET